MMGEDQVAAPALDVDRGAEVVACDGGALDVPAGPAPTEGGVPGGLTGALGLPEQAVERVLLAGPLRVPATLGEQGEHPVAAESGDRTEGRVVGDREVEVAVHVVDAADLLEQLDHVDHERDRLDGADVGVGREHAQCLHVGAEQLRLPLGQRGPVLAVGGGPLQQRIVDVGDVLHVVDPEPGGAPGTVEQVEGDVGGGVAHVGGVVRRDPADVHPSGTIGRRQLDQGVRRAVEDLHRRAACSSGKGSRPGRAAG